MNNRNTQWLLSFTLPLLLGACSGAVDVVADDQASQEASASEGQPSGAWALGHDLSGGGTAARDAADGEEPGGAWQAGHSMSMTSLLTGSVDVTLAPGEARSVCHLVAVDSEFPVRFALHEMTDIPSSIELVATPISAHAARLLPPSFDCDLLAGAPRDPFYAAEESSGSVLQEAPLATLAPDSAVLVRYDVANPGAGTVTATAHVALTR